MDVTEHNSAHFSSDDKFAPCRAALASALATQVKLEPRLIGYANGAWIYIDSRYGNPCLTAVQAGSGERRQILDAAAWRERIGEIDAQQAECWLDTLGRHVYLRTRAGLRRIDLADGSVHAAASAPQRLPVDGFPLVMAGTGEELLSPDGRHAAFLRAHNLWLRDVDGQQPDRPLSSDGIDGHAYATPLYFGLQIGRDGSVARPLVAAWSPDSRYLLSYRLDYRRTHRRHLLRFVDERDGMPAQEQLLSWPEVMTGQTEHVPVAELWLFDTQTGESRSIEGPVFECYDADYATNFFLRQIAWAEDGSALYLLPWARGRKSASLYRYDLSSGQLKLLHTEHSATPIHYLFYQDKFCVSAPAGQEHQVFWVSEQSGWAHIYALDGAGGALRQLTAGDWAVRALLHVDRWQGWLYFSAGGREAGIDPYYRQLYRARLDGSGLQRLTPEDADHEVLFAADGSHFCDSYSRVDLPAQVVLRKTDGSLLHELGAADFSTATANGWQAPETFSVKARDGATDLYGILVKPRKFDPARRYPIVLAVYPGCHTFSVPKRLDLQSRQMFFMLALAELGFVVARVDGMGGPGRSKAFHDVCYRNLQDATLPDQIAAVRQLAQRHAYIDAEKVGIVGSSAGGYTAARALLAYPDFFKVGVALAGCHDFLIEGAEWTEDYGGWPVDTALLTAHSNSPLAAQLRGRLLLVHGALDDNVSPAQSLRLAEALMKAGKHVDLMLVPNGDHGAFYLPEVQQHVWQYFDEHLKD